MMPCSNRQSHRARETMFTSTRFSIHIVLQMILPTSYYCDKSSGFDSEPSLDSMDFRLSQSQINVPLYP